MGAHDGQAAVPPAAAPLESALRRLRDGDGEHPASAGWPQPYHRVAGRPGRQPACAVRPMHVDRC